MLLDHRGQVWFDREASVTKGSRILAGFLIVLLLVFIIIQAAIRGAWRSMPNSATAGNAFVVVGHCYIAVYVIVTIFLAVLAVKLRNRMKSHNVDDKISRSMAVWVIPLLVVHGFVKLIIDIIGSTGSPATIDSEAMFLSDVIISGITYFAVLSSLISMGQKPKPPPEAAAQDTGKPVQPVLVYAAPMPPQSPGPLYQNVPPQQYIPAQQPPQQYIPAQQNVPQQYIPAQQNAQQYYLPQQNVAQYYTPPPQNGPQYAGGPGYPAQV
jgi:arginine exporter protein ArgO